MAWASLAIPLAFTVLLRAPAWAWPRVLAATLVATYATKLGADMLSPALAMAVGACAVTLLSNGLARHTGRSASLTQVPGILLLVPGSVSFEATQALLAADAVAGVQQLFATGLAATGLVGGTLLGHALLPASESLSPRRAAPHDAAPGVRGTGHRGTRHSGGDACARRESAASLGT